MSFKACASLPSVKRQPQARAMRNIRSSSSVVQGLISSPMPRAAANVLDLVENILASQENAGMKQ